MENEHSAHFASSEDIVINGERDIIAKSRILRGYAAEQAPARHTGIAIAGGGIRSASFAFGVIRSLAEADLLRRFDYMSTVSGGGYAGGALQWWWSRLRRDREAGIPGANEAMGLGPADFPLADPAAPGAASPDAAARRYAFLRRNGNYLTPGEGLSKAAFGLVVLRTILIAFAFLAALLVTALLVLKQVPALALPWALPAPLPALLNHPAFLVPLAMAVVGIMAFLISNTLHVVVSPFSQLGYGKAFYRLAAAAFLLAMLLLSVVLRLFIEFGAEGFDASAITWMLLALAFIGGLAIAAFRLRAKAAPLSDAYEMRRHSERLLGRWFPLVAVTLACGLVPVVYALIIEAIPAENRGTRAGFLPVISFLSLLAGPLSALYGYYQKARNLEPGLAGRIFAPLGAAAFLYALLILSFAATELGIKALPLIEPHEFLVTLALFFGVMALVLPFWANVNNIGLHRYYRDRLMELFMPASAQVNAGRHGTSPLADVLQVADLVTPAGMAAPYPLINTNVVLTQEATPQTRSGGDNFIVSPLFMGSTSTGWEQTRHHAETAGGITLASAIAASGAAANANAGYLGTGLTTDPLVSLLMRLFNMRLGLWIRNPGHYRATRLNRYATYFGTAIVGALSPRSGTSRARFIELSDGGHFENLGIYELARRKLAVILIVDGECDGSFAFQSFTAACARISEDFGAVVSVDNADIAKVLPASPGGYPGAAQTATQAHFMARITYRDGSKGTIVYVKATFVANLPLAVTGYRALHADFPHQTTADQFFSQEQLDAYVVLGQSVGHRMIAETKLGNFL